MSTPLTSAHGLFLIEVVVVDQFFSTSDCVSCSWLIGCFVFLFMVSVVSVFLMEAVDGFGESPRPREGCHRHVAYHRQDLQYTFRKVEKDPVDHPLFVVCNWQWLRCVWQVARLSCSGLHQIFVARRRGRRFGFD